MAKKKKRKDSNKKNTGYKIELKGIFLLLFAIIGCCPFGIIADVIKGFSSFLVGVWWALFLVFIGICGIYMIVKRETPDYLSGKYIGLYIIIFSVLALTHAGYVKSIEGIDVNEFKIMDNGVTVVKETIDNMLNFINTGKGLQGGGVLGAIFASILVGLLTLKGAELVCIVLIICGFIMFTGISIYDTLKGAKEQVKKVTNSVKNRPRKKKNIKKK